jgi:hypothetical protein
MRRNQGQIDLDDVDQQMRFLSLTVVPSLSNTRRFLYCAKIQKRRLARVETSPPFGLYITHTLSHTTKRISGSQRITAEESGRHKDSSEKEIHCFLSFVSRRFLSSKILEFIGGKNETRICKRGFVRFRKHAEFDGGEIEVRGRVGRVDLEKFEGFDESGMDEGTLREPMQHVRG